MNPLPSARLAVESRASGHMNRRKAPGLGLGTRQCSVAASAAPLALSVYSGIRMLGTRQRRKLGSGMNPLRTVLPGPVWPPARASGTQGQAFVRKGWCSRCGVNRCAPAGAVKVPSAFPPSLAHRPYWKNCLRWPFPIGPLALQPPRGKCFATPHKNGHYQGNNNRPRRCQVELPRRKGKASPVLFLADTRRPCAARTTRAESQCDTRGLDTSRNWTRWSQ